MGCGGADRKSVHPDARSTSGPSADLVSEGESEVVASVFRVPVEPGPSLLLALATPAKSNVKGSEGSNLRFISPLRLQALQSARHDLRVYEPLNGAEPNVPNLASLPCALNSGLDCHSF